MFALIRWFSSRQRLTLIRIGFLFSSCYTLPSKPSSSHRHRIRLSHHHTQRSFRQAHYTRLLSDHLLNPILFLPSPSLDNPCYPVAFKNLSFLFRPKLFVLSSCTVCIRGVWTALAVVVHDICMRFRCVGFLHIYSWCALLKGMKLQETNCFLTKAYKRVSRGD